MSEFKEKTVSSIGWSGLSQAGRQLGLFVSNVVLARLLTPADFGIIATAIIFSNFAFVIAETGFGTAIIQRDDVTEAHLSSTFWVNVVVGAALCAAFLIATPFISRAYHEPVLVPVMKIIAAMFLIYPAGMVHRVILTRRLEFRAIAVAEVSAAWLAAAAAVALAWFGVGVFSIALQFVIEMVVLNAVLWTLCEWRPKMIFQWKAVRDLADFSVNLLLNSICNYWMRNIDNLLIGLYIGAFQLGLYSRAYAIMLFPLSKVTWMFSRVLIRSFAIIRQDRARVQALFLKMTRVIALITFPMMLGVAASAPDFVACVFGPQWSGMVPVLRVLTVVGMVQSVTAVLCSLYLSHDKTRLNFRVGLVTQTMQVAGIVIGLRWGILGVGLGYAVACVFSEPIDCHFGTGIIGLGLGDFLANVASIFWCTAAMAAAVALLGAALPQSLPALARLALEVAAGAAVYGGLLRLFSVPALGELLDLGGERLRALRTLRVAA